MAPHCRQRQTFFVALFSLVGTAVWILWRASQDKGDYHSQRHGNKHGPIFHPTSTWTNNYLFDDDIRCTVIIPRASDVNEFIVCVCVCVCFFLKKNSGRGRMFSHLSVRQTVRCFSLCVFVFLCAQIYLQYINSTVCVCVCRLTCVYPG